MEPLSASNTTSSFERFIDTIAARHIPYHEAATGQTIAAGSLTFDVLYGVADNNNLNDTSLVLRIQYESVSFLFTSDAETPTESILVNTKRDQLAATSSAVNFSTTMTGANETQPTDPDGTGTAAITIDMANSQVCYTVSVQNIAPSLRWLIFIVVLWV